MKVNTLEDKLKLQIKREYTHFKKQLKYNIKQFDIQNDFSEIVFLCIGTDKLIGDMVGPIVGENLKYKLNQCNKKISIYGNLEYTFNLKNANEMIKNVRSNHANPFIITIDTALGKEDMLYKIVITNGKMEIGKAIGKGIKIDSHINIKGIVGTYHHIFKKNIETLKNAKIESVIYLSTIITNGILDTMNIENKK